MLNPICKSCSEQIRITDDDLKFYEEVSPVFNGKKYLVPPPQECPECRLQRRMCFRNERNLYRTTCGLSGRNIISTFSPEKGYKVYDQKEWWSDAWDSLQYGRDFDFSKTFTEQIISLYKEVPHVSLLNVNTENSYFTNYASNQKKSYLIFGAANNEDCMFGKFVTSCKDCADVLSCNACELCYEGVKCQRCYSCRYFVNSRECSDCTMISECIGCQNCIGCFGLRHKEYYVFNKYAGKENFETIKNEYKNLTPGKVAYLRAQLDALAFQMPHIHAHIYNSENCTGEFITNCKNCQYCFNCLSDGEDSKYMAFVPKGIRSQDCTFCAPDGTELCYYTTCNTRIRNSMFDYLFWFGDSVYYSMECFNSNNLFGCVGLKRNEYCILNKQYSPHDYEVTVAKIIEHMHKTGEWGDFFPRHASPFYYNETIANEYFPLKKEEALAKGFKWADSKSTDGEEQISTYKIPDEITQTNDDICSVNLICEVSGKPYKIIPQELMFYRRMNVCVPHKSPDQRHYERMRLSNPLRLWDRACAKCGATMKTTYAPNSPETVYCEKCYLETI